MHDDERFDTLETEMRSESIVPLDCLDTRSLVAELHRENYTVASAVEAALPAASLLVDAISDRFGRGGRLFYIGAGTSGRLGVLDASECPPTFSVPPGLVQSIIAGGDTALRRSIEGAEDDPDAGARDLDATALQSEDVVVGIAASGRTPYVRGALEFARGRGALTALICCVSNPSIAPSADIVLCAVTGPEALTGSTRMKAGTAQKMLLNIISTAVMVRTGRVYDNLMIDVSASNRKLRDRAGRIVAQACECSPAEAEAALARAGGQAKVAVVMLRASVDREAAEERLERAGGSARAAIVQP